MKLLGIDFGDRYVGLAIADSDSVAVPLSIINYDDSIYESIASVIVQEGIGSVIIGMPYSMSGNDNERTARTKEFIERLGKYVHCPIYTQDERLTSKAASRLKKKGRLDALAAADILQQYIERNATT